MARVVKGLMTVFLIGIPVAAVFVMTSLEEPAALTVVLSEADVTLRLGDREVPVESATVGPIDVSPGPLVVEVTRGGRTLYSEVVVMEKGQSKELLARWPSSGQASAGGVLSQEEEQRIEGNLGVLGALGFSGDGRYIVSAGTESALRVWDSARGSVVGSLVGHKGKVFAVATAGERDVVTVGDDGTVRFWDLATGIESRSVPIGSAWTLRTAAVSPDARRVALGTAASVVRVVDLETRRVIRTHPITPATTGGLAFSPDGRTLLVGLIGDGRSGHDVLALDVADGRVLARFRGHTEPVWSVAFLPDGLHAVSGGSDHTLRLWDVATGRELKRFDDHPGVVLCVAVSPDGRRALAGTGHVWSKGWKAAGVYGIQVWDLEAGIGLGRFETSEPIRTLAFSPDGRRALAGGDDQFIHSWRMPTGPAHEGSQHRPG